MKCGECKGLGGNYPTIRGTWPDVVYDWVDYGECEPCGGTGEVHYEYCECEPHETNCRVCNGRQAIESNE